MTERPWLCAFRWLVASALAAFCLWRGVDAALAYFGSEDAYAYLSDWRSAAREAPEGRLALLCGDADTISPMERSRLVAMAWERAPDPLSPVDASDGFESVDCVLSSAWTSRSAAEKLSACGFSVVSTNEYVKTWSREGVVCRARQDGGAGVSLSREVVALFVELSLLVLALAASVGLRGVGKWPVAASLAVAVALGAVALAHPLLAPNGLGTYGGKAKLLFECGGIPGAFLRSAGGQVLQPSYPPGLVLLAWLHFAISGGCGDRLVQLVVVFAASAACFALLRRSKGPREALPVVIFCLSPVAVRMTSGFYAEPFAALALLLGWDLAGGGSRFVGALVMGLAGAFRPEAGVVAVLFAAGAGADGGTWRGRLAMLAAAVAPSAAWQALCGALGYGGVPDWDICSAPKLGQIAYAAWGEAKALGLLVGPVVALACLVRPVRKPRPGPWAARAFVPMALLLSAIPLACGFYASPHAAWMVDNTVPRLVWYISAVPLFEIVRKWQ